MKNIRIAYLFLFLLFIFSCSENNFHFINYKGNDIKIDLNKNNIIIFINNAFCMDCYKNLINYIESKKELKFKYNIYVVARDPENILNRRILNEDISSFSTDKVPKILFFNNDFLKGRFSKSLGLEFASPCLFCNYKIYDTNKLFIADYSNIFQDSFLKDSFLKDFEKLIK